MEWKSLVYFICVVATFAEEYQSYKEGSLPLAEKCDESVCKLPYCRCSTTKIPGGLKAKDTPQFVTITFDDAVNSRNVLTYRSLYGRKNKNGCPIGATFYVNHEYTDYVIVNELYNQRFEIALHSISHRTPQTFWQNACYEDMKAEFGDQKKQMAHFANIPEDALKGVRIPFLQMTGNASFQVMADHGLLYDCTWPTITHADPGLWPYTLDYASTQDCVVPPCPTASIPGVWVMPMNTWLDLKGSPCAMVDSCFHVPKLTGDTATKEWFQFILENFRRHYEGNRSPFGFFIHEWHLAIHPSVKQALIEFLELVSKLPDIFVVNSAEVIEWVKQPTKVSEYAKQPCRPFTPSHCRRSSCGPLEADHTELNYWMQVCSACPRVYPWVNNPLGQ